jgi:hypothetical protein
MKKLYFNNCFSCQLGLSQQQTVSYSISPTTFEESTAITITINGSSINEATWE